MFATLLSKFEPKDFSREHRYSLIPDSDLLQTAAKDDSLVRKSNIKKPQLSDYSFQAFSSVNDNGISMTQSGLLRDASDVSQNTFSVTNINP